MDSAGDLFGTAQGGGSNSDGTVFEIVKTGSTYSSTPTVLASFTGINGNGASGLVMDAAGDLFGTTRPSAEPITMGFCSRSRRPAAVTAR